MNQISFCKNCEQSATFEKVMVSGYIRKAIENHITGRQISFAINWLFLESILPKKYTAFQCNNCGEVYNVIPETKKRLLYIDYRNDKVISCKVLAEYDNRQYVASWIDGKEVIVSPDEDINWFDDRQTAIEAYIAWIMGQGKTISNNLQMFLNQLKG